MSLRIVRSLAALFAAMAPLIGSADEPRSVPLAPDGTVQLASGASADYEWHQPPRGLAQLVPAGDGLIARTESGRLLRYDPETLRPTRRWTGSALATSLDRGPDGTILAGLADGRVMRVDPATLDVVPIGRLRGKVLWAGRVANAGRPSPRLVGVFEGKHWGEDYEGQRARLSYPFVHDPARGRIVDAGGPIHLAGGFDYTAYRLDRKGRLWLGVDIGEFGGWCASMDLDTGRVHEILPQWLRGWGPFLDGITGFFETRHGQVWAFGGLTHMTTSSAYIFRVDTGRAEPLYDRSKRTDEGGMEGFAKPDHRGSRDIHHPSEPIWGIVEDPATGSLLVVAGRALYRADARLRRWRKITDLDLEGEYGDGIRSVVRMEGPGQSSSLYLATEDEDLVRVADGRATIRHPLAARSIVRIVASSEGLLFFDDDEDDGEVWRRRDGRWERVRFRSKRPPGWDERPSDWESACVLVDRDGSIVTVGTDISGRSKPKCVTARWVDGRPRILGTDPWSYLASESFFTPDGQLWNADGDAVRRFVDGRWIPAGTATRNRNVRTIDWRSIAAPQLVPTGGSGPPWNLVDTRSRSLLRLRYEPGYRKARLEPAALEEPGQKRPPNVFDAIVDPDGQSPNVFDAIAEPDGRLLLATDRGLRAVAADGLAMAPFPIDPGRKIRRLARDGLGRLWLGGEGLILVEGGKVQAMDTLPMLDREEVRALAADPDHRDGIVAAIEDRGVVFVRVGR